VISLMKGNCRFVFLGLDSLTLLTAACRTNPQKREGYAVILGRVSAKE
jgi:hypothetical protein